jgi:hypothetical protein
MIAESLAFPPLVPSIAGLTASGESRKLTVVAVWLEPFDRVVWAVADTRVSRTGPIGGVISDAAAKILPLTLRRYEPGSDGFFSSLTLHASLGFAFAGSALPALNTYAVVSACLQNLASTTPGAPPPSISDVAGLIQRVAERYTRETMTAFEAIVFGWCPLERDYRAFVITPDRTSSPLVMAVNEQQLHESDFVALLGSHRVVVRDEIRRVLSAMQGQNLKRAPKRAIKNLVANGTLNDIGGTLQIGTATPVGFELKSYVRPLVVGRPQAARYFLGIDIDQEIGPVGHHLIGMTGTI